MYAVKAGINSNSFHLIDIGLKGQNLMKINHLKSVFSGLKFSSTSYNHEVYFL